MSLPTPWRCLTCAAGTDIIRSVMVERTDARSGPTAQPMDRSTLAIEEARLQITISGHHVKVTKGMRLRAYELATKVGKFFEGITHLHVRMKNDADNQVAEFTAEVPQNKTIAAKATAADMHAALDEAVEKLERQLTKHKEKLHDRRTRAGKRAGE